MSNINSAATVTWEDFLAPLPRFRSMKEKNQLPMIKIVGVVVSISIFVFAFNIPIEIHLISPIFCYFFSVRVYNVRSGIRSWTAIWGHRSGYVSCVT